MYYVQMRFSLEGFEGFGWIAGWMAGWLASVESKRTLL
jgi:hypothetical protein